jgi:hypothetical protein
MRARTVLTRLAGAACLVASCGLCWWLRESMAASPDRASPLRAALVLAGFALTLLGLRLILTRSDGVSGVDRKAGIGRRQSDVAVEPDPLARLALLDPRVAQVDGITRRAIEAAAQRTAKVDSNPTPLAASPSGPRFRARRG